MTLIRPDTDTIVREMFGRSLQAIDQQLHEALNEDIPGVDVTTAALIHRSTRGVGVLRARQAGVLAGLYLFERVFRLLEPELKVTWNLVDGDEFAPDQEIGHVSGSARALLAAERTALNLLQRLSGIATLTRAFVRAVEGTGVRILDTRKTTPLWRWAEKYAVRVGGGMNHRHNLSDGVLVKDNHLRLIGGLKGLKERQEDWRIAWQRFQPEVEVTTVGEASEAFETGFRRLLLDNMNPEDVRNVVEMAPPDAYLEVSGGVTLDNIRTYAETGVHAISVGRLTHSAPVVDLHFKIHPA